MALEQVVHIRAIEICADVIRNGAYFVLQYRTDESSRHLASHKGILLPLVEYLHAWRCVNFS